MRVFVVSCLIAVMLTLFAAVVSDAPHQDAETQTVLTVELECPCSAGACTHEVMASDYEPPARAESAVLKLPIETFREKDALAETLMSVKFRKHVVTSKVRHPMKLPHYSAGLSANLSGSGLEVEVCNVGVLA